MPEAWAWPQKFRQIVAVTLADEAERLVEGRHLAFARADEDTGVAGWRGTKTSPWFQLRSAAGNPAVHEIQPERCRGLLPESTGGGTEMPFPGACER